MEAFFLLLLIALMLGVFARLGGLKGDLKRLGERVEQLERSRAAPLDLAAVPPPGVQAPAAPLAPLPLPLPAPGVASGAQVTAAPASIPNVASARAKRDVEQMVGGVWLQNAGAVLVLVGVFFLILWGWSTGRFGPGVLVTAGVGVGLGIAWRGDRMRRTLQGIGHALIGLGCGVVYLSLYLGHWNGASECCFHEKFLGHSTHN